MTCALARLGRTLGRILISHYIAGCTYDKIYDRNARLRELLRDCVTTGCVGYQKLLINLSEYLRMFEDGPHGRHVLYNVRIVHY